MFVRNMVLLQHNLNQKIQKNSIPFKSKGIEFASLL